jgi:hypothetical protein
MEDSNLEKVHSLIKSIEKKNLELENYLSNLKIISRATLLKDIATDILKKNVLIKDFHTRASNHISYHKKLESSKKDATGNLIFNIQNNPAKRVFFLQEFLKQFEDISENDINVILKSLKDKNEEDLIRELSNLIKIFKIKDFE